MRTADEIRALLSAPDFSSIKTWRVAPAAADHAVAERDVHSAAESPTYVARFGHVDVAISAFEHERLLAAGATDLGHPPGH